VCVLDVHHLMCIDSVAINACAIGTRVLRWHIGSDQHFVASLSVVLGVGNVLGDHTTTVQHSTSRNSGMWVERLHTTRTSLF
jgi:hypothetical protein